MRQNIIEFYRHVLDGQVAGGGRGGGGCICTLHLSVCCMEGGRGGETVRVSKDPPPGGLIQFHAHLQRRCLCKPALA